MQTRTTTALLEDLADPENESVWVEFDARFRPILAAFGRRLGLNEEDAADAAQDALARFVQAYRSGGYDRERGRLRSWMIGIARNAVRESQRKRLSRREVRGASAVIEMPDNGDVELIWEEEAERALLQEGLRELRKQSKANESTIRAFELLALGGRSPASVAEELGMSSNDVYLAKHRCLQKLRAILTDLREAYEG